MESVCKERKVFFSPCLGKKLTQGTDNSLSLCRLCLARGLCWGGCSVTSCQEHTGGWEALSQLGAQPTALQHTCRGGVLATSHMLQVKTAERRSPGKGEQLMVRLK